jgi:hypothetical protein
MRSSGALDEQSHHVCAGAADGAKATMMDAAFVLINFEARHSPRMRKGGECEPAEVDTQAVLLPDWRESLILL